MVKQKEKHMIQKKIETVKGMGRQMKQAAVMVSIMAMRAMPVFASTAQHGQDAINGVLKIIYLITMALGILFVIVGFVRLIIAHSQEDAPGQQRSSMFIAVGVALLAVQPVLSAINPASWFTPTP